LNSKKTEFIQGNHALAQGALYAGCRFFAGYPITPSSEIAEFLAQQMPLNGGTFIQMEDEIAAMAAILGGSLTGAKALTATSGPGFSLKQENLGYGYLCEIPCVVVNIMRGGPSTGLPTAPSQSDIMAARWGTHGDHPCIALAPASIKEMFFETVRAFNLAEQFRMPIIILSDEIIGHMRERLVFPEEGELEIVERKKPTVPPEDYNPYDTQFGDIPPLASFGSGYRFHITGLNHDYTGFPTNEPKLVSDDEIRLMRKVDGNLKDIEKWESYKLDDADMAIVAIGSTARCARMVINQLREQGLKIGLFRPITLWPFPEKQIKELAGQVKFIMVPEMNLGQMILEVERVIAGKCDLHGLHSVSGEPIHPNMMLEKIKEVL